MITIKLPYTTTEDLLPILKQYNSVVRYSYNRFKEGLTYNDIYYLCKDLNNIGLLGTKTISYGVFDGKFIHTRNKDRKVIFGGKNNFIKRLKGKISKEEFETLRLRPMTLQGQTNNRGNNYVKLDVIENNQIILKLSRNSHVTLNLPKLRKNYESNLFRLQEINNISIGQNGHKYQVQFDLDYIYISFEEFKEEKLQLNPNRYMGIDMNPQNIGISILEGEKIIHTQEFNLSPIFDKIFSQRLSSSDKRSKYLHHKLQFETLEISKSISILSKHFGCSMVFVEDLQFKQKLSGDQKYNKVGNRKNKNLWKKNLFVQNLTKRLNSLGIKIHSVNPSYSSFVGNLRYDYTDPINSSIEIGRRGYEYRIRKNKKGFYPNLSVKHQWKEMVTQNTNWKEFFSVIKNLKLKYRVSLEEVKYPYKVFEKNSTSKSGVINYVFYNHLC